jgi:iron complex transport system ATP-binding protein
MADALVAYGVSVLLGRRQVLHDVSLAARIGEVLAVIGPNGAGKSTLLKTLAGLVPYQGRVELDGAELRSLSASQRARRVSFVPQHSLLSAALSVREVVRLGRYVHRGALGSESEHDRRAVEAALVDTDVGALAERSFADLSTGEQKRVLLARALCTEARVLLLDEPTASLDIEHALRLFVLLRALAARGCAVVLVLHQLEHALAYADRTLLLQRGAALALGATREVLTADNVRALHGVLMVPAGAPGFALPERTP